MTEVYGDQSNGPMRRGACSGASSAPCSSLFFHRCSALRPHQRMKQQSMLQIYVKIRSASHDFDISTPFTLFCGQGKLYWPATVTPKYGVRMKDLGPLWPRNSKFSRGSAPYPPGGAYTAPQTPQLSASRYPRNDSLALVSLATLALTCQENV